MYNVHMNGSKIAETEANQHIVTGVEQGKEHEFAVDKAGSSRQTVKIFVPYPEQRVLNKRVTRKLMDGAEIAWDTLLPIGEGRVVDGYYVYTSRDDTNPIFVTATKTTIRGIDVHAATFEYCVEAVYNDGVRSRKEFVVGNKHSSADVIFSIDALTHNYFNGHFGDIFPLEGDTITIDCNGQTKTSTMMGEFHIFTSLKPSTKYDIKVTYNVNVAHNGPSFVKMFEVTTKDNILPAVTLKVDQITFNGAKISWTPPAGVANIKYYVIMVDGVEVAKVERARTYEYTGALPDRKIIFSMYFETIEGYLSDGTMQSVTTLPLNILKFLVPAETLTSSSARVSVNVGPYTNDIVSVFLNGTTSDNITPENMSVQFINLVPSTYTLSGYYIRNFGLTTEQRHAIPELTFQVT